MPTIKIKKIIDNTSKVRGALASQLAAAAEDVKDIALDNVLWQMMYGYHEPHGADGHTEIYDTGALYQSIEADVGTSKFVGLGVGDRFTVEVSAGTEYASYVHNGTYKLNGRPFITDGINRSIPEINGAIKKHLKG